MIIVTGTTTTFYVTIVNHMKKLRIISNNVRRTYTKFNTRFSKIQQFINTVSGPKVNKKTFKMRLKICNQCPDRKDVDGKSYCNACGCGQWKMAELSSKLWWARLECPKDKFSKEEE